jgi:hypothetical protein
MTEELDLGELFSNFVKFISRNSKLLFIIVIVGVTGVIGYQKLKTPYYETKAICKSGISEYERVEYEEGWLQRTAIDIINHLEINVENRDYNELSLLLGVDINVAEKIKKIEAEQLYQKDMNEEFFSLNKFEIMLKVFDNQAIEEIQDGLSYYFNHNPYVSEHYREFIESKEQVIKDINNEMKLLEEIRKKGLADQHNVNSSLKVVNGYERTKIDNQTTELSEYREKIRTQIATSKPLSFVQGFAKVNKEEDDILVWGLLGGFISFLIGLLVALIKEVKKA